jgi:hypothetical protein
MVQFNKLEKIEIGGTKGKDLSESVRLIGSDQHWCTVPLWSACTSASGPSLGFGVKMSSA